MQYATASQLQQASQTSGNILKASEQKGREFDVFVDADRKQLYFLQDLQARMASLAMRVSGQGVGESPVETKPDFSGIVGIVPCLNSIHSDRQAAISSILNNLAMIEKVV